MEHLSRYIIVIVSVLIFKMFICNFRPFWITGKCNEKGPFVQTFKYKPLHREFVGVYIGVLLFILKARQFADQYYLSPYQYA